MAKVMMHAPFYNSNLGHLGEATAGGSEGTAASLGLRSSLACILKHEVRLACQSEHIRSLLQVAGYSC